MAAVTRSFADLFATEKARLWQGLSRSLTGLALAVFAALAAVVGLTFIVLGGYASLARVWEPWQAGLLVGAVVIVLALIAVALVARMVRRQGRTAPPPMAARPHPAAETATPGLMSAAMGEMLGRADIKARDIALVALVTGLALGVSPRLRHYLKHRLFGYERTARYR